jgi:hypothetical protein
MAAIGMALIWFGYWSGLSGVSMVKGWNNSPLALANPAKPATFTTACYTGSGVFPTGKESDSGSCGGAASSSGTITMKLADGLKIGNINPKAVAVAGRGK